MKPMTTQDIFKNSEMPKDMEMTWQQAYAVVAESLNTQEFRILRDGNTLLWYHILPPGNAETWLFNADGQDNLVEHYRNYCLALQRAGFKTFSALTTRRNELIALQKAGYPVQITIKPYDSTKKTYIGHVTLEK